MSQLTYSEVVGLLIVCLINYAVGIANGVLWSRKRFGDAYGELLAKQQIKHDQQRDDLTVTYCASLQTVIDKLRHDNDGEEWKNS